MSSAVLLPLSFGLALLPLPYGIPHLPHACTLGLQRGLAHLGISLTITGLCFLALWSVDLIHPPPRRGALLLIPSMLGAGSVAVGLSPRSASWEVPFAVVVSMLFVLVAALMLLSSDEPGHAP
jgi:hypothetical protein